MRVIPHTCSSTVGNLLLAKRQCVVETRCTTRSSKILWNHHPSGLLRWSYGLAPDVSPPAKIEWRRGASRRRRRSNRGSSAEFLLSVDDAGADGGDGHADCTHDDNDAGDDDADDNDADDDGIVSAADNADNSHSCERDHGHDDRHDDRGGGVHRDDDDDDVDGHQTFDSNANNDHDDDFNHDGVNSDNDQHTHDEYDDRNDDRNDYLSIRPPRAPGRGHARPRGGADVKDQRKKKNINK